MPVLKLPYPPSANRLWRVFNGYIVKSTEARQYQRQVQMMALDAGIVPLSGPVGVNLTLHPKKPKRDTGKRPRCIDASNAIKVVEDALNGVGWVDDAYNEVITVRRGPPVEGGALVVSWEGLE